VGERRKGREFALQMLYQIEVGGSREEALATFWEGKDASPEIRQFAEALVRGTLTHLEEIDALLRQGLEHWRLARIAAVDRNVLRLAAFEFLHQPQTPRLVIIDEAIDLAKCFGGDESGLFVNGVLDGLRKRLEPQPPPDAPPVAD
jgi:N utilization substance protein B